MPESTSVRSTLIYDGRCSFCRLWLEYVQALLGNRIEWIASQDIGDRFPGLARDDFKNSVILVHGDGAVSRGAGAIFEAISLSPRHAWWLALYQRLPPFKSMAEFAYGIVARHRSAAFHLTRILFGSPIRPLAYELTESLFLRLLGVVFLFAFWSLEQQILGLAGSHGIIPAAQVLESMRAEIGPRTFLFAPSLFWANASDSWINWASRIGILVSVLLAFSGWLGQAWQRTTTGACFFLYLSLVSIGQPFTLFQWDALLLETAFLALFAGTPLLVWASRFLVFRLIFESGCVKLLSGDPNWRNLRALRFHFMTQPLPNPIAWYVYQAPGWLLDTCTFLALTIELVCPWLLFFPRRVRQAGAGALILLQLLILLTGNYAFFNWLTIILCLWAFDDGNFRSVRRVLSRSVVTIQSAVRRQLLSAVLGGLMLLGAVQVISFFAQGASAPFARIFGLLAPWQIVNSYGLFAVMTTTRPELIYEGSEDGQTWKEYSFPYKPGDVTRPLPLVAPFQPRLDWQLWFAALDGNYQEDRWTGNLAVRLLQGDAAVLKLLERSPFSRPPKYVRVALYDYWFTDEAERRKTGAIWNRRFERLYLPAISLEQIRGQ